MRRAAIALAGVMFVTVGMPKFPAVPERDLADVYAYLVSMKPGLPAKDIPQLSGN